MSHERTKTTPSATETGAEYCALAECAAREHARRLREASFRRACESPAVVHCASTDRRDYITDEILAVVRACVADCVASLYPRADPRRFVEIINRSACKCQTCLYYAAKTGRQALYADEG